MLFFPDSLSIYPGNYFFLLFCLCFFTIPFILFIHFHCMCLFSSPSWSSASVISRLFIIFSYSASLFCGISVLFLLPLPLVSSFLFLFFLLIIPSLTNTFYILALIFPLHLILFLLLYLLSSFQVLFSLSCPSFCILCLFSSSFPWPTVSFIYYLSSSSSLFLSMPPFCVLSYHHSPLPSSTVPRHSGVC